MPQSGIMILHEPILHSLECGSVLSCKLLFFLQKNKGISFPFSAHDNRSALQDNIKVFDDVIITLPLFLAFYTLKL